MADPSPLLAPTLANAVTATGSPMLELGKSLLNAACRRHCWLPRRVGEGEASTAAARFHGGRRGFDAPWGLAGETAATDEGEVDTSAARSRSGRRGGGAPWGLSREATTGGEAGSGAAGGGAGQADLGSHRCIGRRTGAGGERMPDGASLPLAAGGWVGE
nr:unnamed protein product [Digitaria exilis]CAB3503323.1 unnamed protein product [Digitaria exilis]